MKIMIKPYKAMKGIYLIELETGEVKLATLNMVPQKAVYRERLVDVEGKEYRLWDPFRSKLAAAILNGLPSMPIRLNCGVLYLGAASGTTVSHISDIVGVGGHIYAVEFSPRSLRELINNLSSRHNVLPILADARVPQSYRLLLEKVNVVYCDIAQAEQARVVAENAELFLRERGSVLLAVKARSIDSIKNPEDVFEQEVDVLRHRGFKITAVVHLEPYDRDHIMVLAS